MVEENKEQLDLDAAGSSKDKAVGRNKRGALSLKEMDYIKDNIKIKTVKEISKEINKSIQTIRKYCYKENLLASEENRNATEEERFLRIRGLLRSRNYWPEVKEQFNENELRNFETLWTQLYLQFEEDVTPSEELQIKKHITMEILKDRVMKKSYSLQLESEKIKKIVAEEHAKPADIKNIDAIRMLTSSMEKFEMEQSSYNKQFLDIVDKQKETEKALRISRDQRVQQVADATKNWSNILLMLNKIEVRERIGKHIEIMSAAQTNQKKILEGYHTFIDGSIDIPLLNSDSVMKEED